MKKKILVTAPALTASGYGEQSRFALRALRSREDLFDIYLVATSWGQCGWIHQDDEERTWIDSLIFFPFKNSFSQSKKIVPINIPMKKSTEPYMNPRIKSAKLDLSDV